MIGKAQRKLREAQFYHRRLREVQESAKWRSEAEAFRFFFSAFITTARNVSWVMKKEQTEKYEAWLPKWESMRKPEDQKMLCLTRKLRNEEEKEGGRDPDVEWEKLTLEEMLRIHRHDESHPVYQYQPQPMPQRLESGSTVTFFEPKYYFEHEGERTEVMKVCSEYLNYLERMISDFLSAAQNGEQA